MNNKGRHKGHKVQRKIRWEMNWNDNTGYLKTLNKPFSRTIAWKAPAEIRIFRFCSSAIDKEGVSIAKAPGSYRTTYPFLQMFSD